MIPVRVQPRASYCTTTFKWRKCMIKLVRVDHRLLHGQVIFSWTKQVGTNYIIVADDKVPE